jgi:hypothetical protein
MTLRLGTYDSFVGGAGLRPAGADAAVGTCEE